MTGVHTHTQGSQPLVALLTILVTTFTLYKLQE